MRPLFRFQHFRATPWQRRLLIALITVVSSHFYLSVWAEGFRISAAAVLYPALLISLMRDSHRPTTGAVTGLCVTAVRILLDLFQGVALGEAIWVEYPGGVFYFCYECLLCLVVKDRRTIPPVRLTLYLWFCDFLSNVVNLALSSRLSVINSLTVFALLGLIALVRSAAACGILYLASRYRRLLLKEEHEQRYRRLFLMTADLKTELYFLQKDAEDIESVMSSAYRLHERLEAEGASEELSGLALSIARDVHEIKKDNLRIIRGLESEVAQAYDHENMALRDLLTILEVSTRQMLGSDRADIRLDCRCGDSPPIREHYRVLSILKNLVTNAVEAIQSGSGRGWVRVDASVEGELLSLVVSDDGPGIPPRAMKMLFQVGYSTKFDPDTGNINRGVGLSAVQFLVEELGGSIQVQSQPGQGAQFQVKLPLTAVTGGNHEDLHY